MGSLSSCSWFGWQFYWFGWCLVGDCLLFAADSFGAGLVMFIFVLQCILLFFLFDVFVLSRSGYGVFRLLLVVFCFVLSYFGLFKLVVSGISVSLVVPAKQWLYMFFLLQTVSCELN